MFRYSPTDVEMTPVAAPANSPAIMPAHTTKIRHTGSPIQTGFASKYIAEIAAALNTAVSTAALTNFFLSINPPIQYDKRCSERNNKPQAQGFSFWDNVPFPNT